MFPRDFRLDPTWRCVSGRQQASPLHLQENALLLLISWEIWRRTFRFKQQVDQVHFEISGTTPLRIHAALRVIPAAGRHTGMSRVQVGGSCMIHARVWTRVCTELMGAHNGHKFPQSCTRVLQRLNCVSWDGKMRDNRTEAGTRATLQVTWSPRAQAVHLH